jgi:predicted DNA-binding transcriptional regulator AlpA
MAKKLHSVQIALARKAAALKQQSAPRIEELPDLADEPAPAGERRKGAHGARAPPEDVRLLSKFQVLEITNKSYPTLWAMMVAGRFPRPVVVGNENRWISSEVAEWIQALPRRKLKGDA